MVEFINLLDLWGEPFDYIIDNAGSTIAQEFVNRINKLQTYNIPDIVQCKNCTHWHKGQNESDSWEWCSIFQHNIGENEYCSYGEPKQND